MRNPVNITDLWQMMPPTIQSRVTNPILQANMVTNCTLKVYRDLDNCFREMQLFFVREGRYQMIPNFEEYHAPLSAEKYEPLHRINNELFWTETIIGRFGMWDGGFGTGFIPNDNSKEQLQLENEGDYIKVYLEGGMLDNVQVPPIQPLPPEPQIAFYDIAPSNYGLSTITQRANLNPFLQPAVGNIYTDGFNTYRILRIVVAGTAISPTWTVLFDKQPVAPAPTIQVTPELMKLRKHFWLNVVLVPKVYMVNINSSNVENGEIGQNFYINIDRRIRMAIVYAMVLEFLARDMAKDTENTYEAYKEKYKIECAEIRKSFTSIRNEEQRFTSNKRGQAFFA